MMHSIIYALICTLHGGGGGGGGNWRISSQATGWKNMADNSSNATCENEEISGATSGEMDVELIDKG